MSWKTYRPATPRLIRPLIWIIFYSIAPRIPPGRARPNSKTLIFPWRRSQFRFLNPTGENRPRRFRKWQREHRLIFSQIFTFWSFWKSFSWNRCILGTFWHFGASFSWGRCSLFFFLAFLGGIDMRSSHSAHCLTSLDVIFMRSHSGHFSEYFEISFVCMHT